MHSENLRNKNRTFFIVNIQHQTQIIYNYSIVTLQIVSSGSLPS